MVKLRENENFKKLTLRGGISLITLVVTIVVIIILSTAVILSLNNNNVITNANDTRCESDKASMQSLLDVAISKAVIKYQGAIKVNSDEISVTDGNVGEITFTSSDLPGIEGKIVFGEGEDTEDTFYTGQKLPVYAKDTKWYVDEKGKIVLKVGAKLYGDKSNLKGIRNKSIEVTSSKQEIIFKNTVTLSDIQIQNDKYQTYEIEGISNEKEGIYVKTGNVTGKAGDLSVEGDINNATFKYTLTNIMKGDEIFYVKVNIDGVKYIQELSVIQGDTILYEEDFVGFVWNLNGSETTIIETVENEKFSNGSAINIICNKDGTGNPTIEFDFYGTGITIVSAILSDNTLVSSREIKEVSTDVVIKRIPLILDYIGIEEYNVKIEDKNLGINEYHYELLWANGSYGDPGENFYFDGVFIYK